MGHTGEDPCTFRAALLAFTLHSLPDVSAPLDPSPCSSSPLLSELLSSASLGAEERLCFLSFFLHGLSCWHFSGGLRSRGPEVGRKVDEDGKEYKGCDLLGFDVITVLLDSNMPAGLVQTPPNADRLKLESDTAVKFTLLSPDKEGKFVGTLAALVAADNTF